MELKNYFRQNPAAAPIKYDKYADTLRPDSNADRLISGKSVFGTEIEYLRVARALVLDFFILLSWMLLNTMEHMPRKPNRPRKPKHHAGQIKTHVSLSFTCPLELEGPMNRAAAAKGVNRSQYICWLVMEDIRTQERHPQQGDGKTLLPKVPPRIRRKP